MMRIMILILLISANCMKMKCDEETRSTETTSEISEKTELLSAEVASLESKFEKKETNEEESKVSGDGEEIRVLRSSSSSETRKETHIDDSSQVHSTEVSFTEKSAPDEVTGGTGIQADGEVKETKSRTNSAKAEQDKTKSAENVEKRLEELPETSRSAAEVEDRKTVDPLEASADNKINDNEMASSKVDDTDRNSEPGEIKQKSKDLDESLATRRMLSSPDYIVTVLDTKTRADTTPAEVDLEVKVVPSQKLNTYNNLNEFGTKNSVKLIDPSLTDLTKNNLPVKSNSPVIRRVANQEIFNQPFLAKYNPQSELNIHFPNVNLDIQERREWPTYLKVKHDEFQTKDQFIRAQNSHFKPKEEKLYFNPENQQRQYQSQRVMDTKRHSENKQIENLGVETRNLVRRFYNNQLPLNEVFNNKQFANMNEEFRKPVQQFYQNPEIVNANYKRYENLDHDPRNQMQGIGISKTPLNYNEQGNQYPYQSMMESKIIPSKELENNRLANPYSYLQQSSSPEISLVNAPIQIVETIPKKIKILFQKLANASEYPRKLSTNWYRYNNIQDYPYFINPNNRAISYFPGPS